MALPRRQPPNHHHQRGDAIYQPIYDSGAHYDKRPVDPGPADGPIGVDDEPYVLVRRTDLDHLRARLEIDDDLAPTVFYDVARCLVDNARPVDVAVDSAGDGVSGPADNTPRRLPAEGDLWRLLGRLLAWLPAPDGPGVRANHEFQRRELRDAIVARYGDR